jgi:hypothetical protein
MRKTIFRSKALALVGIGALAGPCLLPAQASSDSNERTHIVRPNDTLWSLARVYLGDPWQWRELLRLNPSIGGDPTQLKVGERIVVRGAAAPVVEQRLDTPAPSAAPVKAFASEGSAPAPDAPANLDSAAAPPTRTIFFAPPTRTTHVSNSAGESDATSDSVDASIARIRLTDFVAAPYVLAAPWPNDPGRVVTTPSERFSPGSALRLAPPRGHEAVSGARFLTYRLGPHLDSGRVIIPTGIISTTSPATGEETASGRVEAIFDAKFPGDGLLPLETVIPTIDSRPTRLVSEIAGRVVWSSARVDSASSIRVVILDVGSRSGVRVGDRVLISHGDAAADGGAVSSGGPVAIGMVVRSGLRGASAIISYGSAEVATGARVRVVPVLP